MEKKKVFKIVGSALLAVLVLVLFVGLALAPAFSPMALSDDDVGGSDVSTYADSSSPIGVWLMDESISLSGNDTVQVADFYYLTSSGSVSSSLCQYMRVEAQDSLIKLYYCSSASDSGLYVYDTTFGWVNDNYRYISVVSAYEYPGFNFLAASAQKQSDDPYYGPFQPDTPEPPAPDPDPDPDPPAPDPGDGSYDEGYSDGYDDGYDTGYDEGYLDGFNDGVLDDLKNPLVFFVQPIASFLDTPLFAGVSIGNMLALLIFIFVGLIFLRMFAGG